jgi:hypothetical protein
VLVGDDTLELDVNSAPLCKLIESFNNIFPENLKNLIGADLDSDIRALANLRNLFAHGRNLMMEFEVSDSFTLKGTLDSNQLKLPAERLYKAGLIKNFDMDSINYNEFHSIFYSDEVLLYFYKAIENIDIKLKSFAVFPVERNMFNFNSSLPPLNP